MRRGHIFGRIGIALATVAAHATALAQDGGQALETITVTGSRISYHDLLDTPAVSVTRPGGLPASSDHADQRSTLPTT